MTPANRYFLTSKLFGTLLILSGGLKYHALISSADRRLFGLFVVAIAEILFGVWLWSGYWPRLTRVVSMGLLLGLIHISIGQAIEKKPSCGCFGVLQVNPWIVLLIDILFWILFAVSIPSEDGQHRFSRSLMLVLSVLAVLFLSVSLLAYPYRPIHQIVLAPKQLAPDDILIAHKRNYDSLLSIDAKYKVVAKNLLVNKEVREERVIKSGRIITISKPFVEVFYRYRIQDMDVRRDPDPIDRPGATTVVLRTGQAVQYSGKLKQAWVRSGYDIEVDPVDPRLFGFAPPIASIQEWYNASTISKHESANNDELFSLSVRDSKNRHLTVNAVKKNRYLPTEITYRHDDGSLSYHASLEYISLFESGPLFPSKMIRRLYPAGMTEKVADRGFTSEFTYELLPGFIVDQGLTEDVFDLSLPAQTRVSHKGRAIRMKSETKSSSLPHDRESDSGSSTFFAPLTASAKAWFFTSTVWALLFGLSLCAKRWTQI